MCILSYVLVRKAVLFCIAPNDEPSGTRCINTVRHGSTNVRAMATISGVNPHHTNALLFSARLRTRSVPRSAS